MNEARIREILQKGEGITLEFKECKNALSKDVCDTVCAFLNRSGGEILLGVRDNGAISGIDADAIDRIKKDFSNSTNNPEKISPPFVLSVEQVEMDGRSVLYVYVPESSQVHRCAGKILDRNADGDFNITGNNPLVTALYLRKQATYSENTVYPYAALSDLRIDLIARVRKLASLQKNDHPWASLDDMGILKAAQLFKKDVQTGKEGFTLGAILLFGKDETILSAIPHHRTDAILRRVNIDRYDDRDDIRTNLFESHDRLFAFGEKHLNDTFYLERETRISLRDKILREVCVNLLVHREFTNAFPAKFVIESDMFFTENGNKPHGSGIISPDTLVPFPKNPAIARVFKEIGWADELGSGTRNLFKYCKAYAGKDPKFIEGDIFKFSLNFSASSILNLSSIIVRKATQEEEEHFRKVLEFCEDPKTPEAILNFLRLRDRERFRVEILSPLLEKGLLAPTMPDKPNSPTQKYITIKPGR